LPAAGLLQRHHRGSLQAFLRKNASQKELVWVGRAMVLLIALIAIAVP
jgi:Na+/proline symporter